jgi:hypothetical protein
MKTMKGTREKDGKGINMPEEGSQFLSRKQIAARWGVCIETVKRRERDGTLKGLHFNARLVRYRLQDVRHVESQAQT